MTAAPANGPVYSSHRLELRPRGPIVLGDVGDCDDTALLSQPTNLALLVYLAAPVWMLLGGALFTACVPVTSYEGLTVSAPAAIPPGWRGEIDENGRTILQLDEIDLRVDVRNATGREKVLYLSPLPPFVWDYQSFPLGDPDEALVIFLELHPKRAGYSFDPMAVRLSRYRDQAVTPREFIGPGRPSGGNTCLDPTGFGGRHLEGKTAPETLDILPGEEATCFVLEYDVGSSPSIEFRLLIGGLSRRGDPVELPELHFTQRQIEKPLSWTPPAFPTRRSKGQDANPR